MKTWKWIISGRVQGVGYRYFSKEEASLRGLFGWVRNLPNRDVEIHVQGSERLIEDLKLTLQKGPYFAKVLDFKEELIEEESFFDFQIKR